MTTVTTFFPMFVLMWLSAIVTSQTMAQSQSCTLTLPSYPNNYISIGLNAYYQYNYPTSPYSLMTAQLSIGPVPAAPPAPLYAAWCVDANTEISVAQGASFSPYTGYLYSSEDVNLNSELGQLNPGVFHPPTVYVSPAVWKQVNYILNHRDFTKPPYSGPVSGSPDFSTISFAYYWDVQVAINAFVGGPLTDHFDVEHPAVIQALTNAAIANADAWVPQCGDKIAAIAYLDATPFTFPADDPQLIILEVPCTCMARPAPLTCSISPNVTNCAGNSASFTNTVTGGIP